MKVSEVKVGKQYLELVAKQVLKLTPFVAIISSWFLGHCKLHGSNSNKRGIHVSNSSENYVKVGTFIGYCKCV